MAAFMLLSAMPAVAAPRGESALDFGERLYRYLPEHVADDPPFTPPLKQLFDRVHRNGAYGTSFSRLPLCDCEALDPHYRLTNLHARSARGGVTLVVDFRNDGARQVRLDLVRHNGTWAIADIHGSDTPSFAALAKRLAQAPIRPVIVDGPRPPLTIRN